MAVLADDFERSAAINTRVETRNRAAARARPGRPNAQLAIVEEDPDGGSCWLF
jgi:hypothetical protein